MVMSVGRGEHRGAETHGSITPRGSFKGIRKEKEMGKSLTGF